VNFSEDEILIKLEEIKHPFIDCSLIELGLVKNVTVNGSNVIVNFALPFQNIPIKDKLIFSIKKALEELGAKLETKITIMTQEERQKFLNLEKENWK